MVFRQVRQIENSTQTEGLDDKKLMYWLTSLGDHAAKTWIKGRFSNILIKYVKHSNAKIC